MNYVVASSKCWDKKLRKFLSGNLKTVEITYITDEAELDYQTLKRISPDFIFFTHWSTIIPEEIFKEFECIIFHMTDLPFGRGGSPLQNLIVREIYKTKITALKCVKELDAGPIYMQRELSLYGTAQEIYYRSALTIREMIVDIIENSPTPTEQEGQAVIFKRRKPEDSNISKLTSLNQIFDYIRMMDAEGYPSAYLEKDGIRLEFSRASFVEDSIYSDVKITLMPKRNYE